MKHDVPVPNPFCTTWLKGDRCREIVSAETDRAFTMFRAVGAQHARTGAEVSSARADVAIGGIRGDRWIGRMTVGGPDTLAPYTASEEYGAGRTGRHFQAPAHDLNTVLNLMATA